MYVIYFKLYLVFNLFYYQVTCGLCQKTMFQSEYENIHKWTHYNLSWLDDNEKPVS